jgi:hypothetical protein
LFLKYQYARWGIYGNGKKLKNDIIKVNGEHGGRAALNGEGDLIRYWGLGYY